MSLIQFSLLPSKRLISGLFCMVFTICLFAQNGILSGTVKDRLSQELLVGASVQLEGLPLGAVTDVEGRFRLANIPPKSYNIVVSYLGYETQTRYNVVVTTGNATVLNVELAPDAQNLGEIVISENKSIRVASTETPLSIQNLSIEEIKSNPGGNFDISRVLQALPGVGGTAGSVGGYRNDLIIRGGGPSENVYYLDGVEIPVINHFSTQGAAGGPLGILNVSFIEDVTLTSSAFNARYDNTLSSVLQFKQKDGNPDRFQGNFRLSATEVALTGEGPLGKNVTFLASARRSYLQFLFDVIGLPIRPNFWDFQYKINWKIDPKTTFTTLGVGAIDEFSFAAPEEATPENLYVLSSSPLINQWNYTQGFTLKRLVDDGYWNLTFSRNMLDNQLDQFRDNFDGNQRDEAKRIFGSQSQEIENKLRFDMNRFSGNWKWSYGAVFQYVKYNIDAFSVIQPEILDSSGNLLQPRITSDFSTAIDFFRYGLFAQVNRTFFSSRLALSFGIRADGNSFTETGNELWRTLSPRFSASYGLAPKWKINASAGRYFKLPIYTALGFRDENNQLVNQGLPYTQVDHFVAGLEFIPSSSTRITLEGFYKDYADYLISEFNGLSLANQGGNFGIIGNEKVVANGTGEAYGAELLVQKKLTKNLFFTASYTLFWSKFSNSDGNLTPSAWDNRHLVSVILGRKFGKNWELGLKWRYQGGVPYTPFDLDGSLANYSTLGTGVLDYGQLNTLRLDPFMQFDFRLDKKWNFRRTTLDVFLDVQNAFVQKTPEYPKFTLQRNATNTDFETRDGQPLNSDGSNGIPVILGNPEASVLPTIGFIFEF